MIYNYWRAIKSIAINQKRQQCLYIHQSFDLICLKGIWKRGRLLITDGLVEDWWMTYARQRTGQGPVGWHNTTIYVYELWRWAAIISNFFLYSTVQYHLLLFVWGLNTICTFVLSYATILSTRLFISMLRWKHSIPEWGGWWNTTCSNPATTYSLHVLYFFCISCCR